EKVLGARAAVRLGQDVSQARQFENRPNRLTGGNTRTGQRRDQANRTAAALAQDQVRDACAFHRELEHRLAGLLRGLFDRRGDFVGLAVADADAAGAVAGDNQRRKAEGTAALDDLAAAVDADHAALDGIILVVPPPAAVAVATATTTLAASAAAGPATSGNDWSDTGRGLLLDIAEQLLGRHDRVVVGGTGRGLVAIGGGAGLIGSGGVVSQLAAMR